MNWVQEINSPEITMDKQKKLGIAVVILLLAATIILILLNWNVPGIEEIGGTELTYELDFSRIEGDESGVAEKIRRTIARRLSLYGFRGAAVSVKAPHRLVVQLPGVTAGPMLISAKRLLAHAGVLSFRLLGPPELQTKMGIEEVRALEDKYLSADRAWIKKKREFEAKFRSEGKIPPGFSEPRPEAPEFIARKQLESGEADGKRIQTSTSEKWYVLHNREEYKVSGELLGKVNSTYDENGRPAVAFSFNKEGAKKFGALTKANLKKTLAIVLDDSIRQMATIRSPIYEQGQLTGSFTHEEVRGIVTMLRAGSLPAPIKLISERTVPRADS